MRSEVVEDAVKDAIYVSIKNIFLIKDFYCARVQIKKKIQKPNIE